MEEKKDEEKETHTKSKCPHCKKLYNYRQFIRHKCSVLWSQNTSYANEDLVCCFCNLQTENNKLLEIHMISCVNRNAPQNCKLCKNPIRLRSHNKQYCANCSTAKEGNMEYDLRFKAATLSPSNSSRSCTVPVRNIENSNFQTVNCTDSRSSLTSARSGRIAMPNSQNQKKRKLNIHIVEQQVKKKETHVTNLKIARTKEQNTEKQVPTGMNQSKESHHASDKLSKNSGRNVGQQKKSLKRTNAEYASEKFKNNDLQKLKTSKQIDRKIRLTTKKNNSTNKVTIQLLLDTVPENDCGMLLKSTSANKMEQFFKCCRCGKLIKSIKFGLTHLSNCKSNKLLRTEVSASDVIWVCTFCQSSFDTNRNLNEHLKRCNLLGKKYDSACGNRCENCHFICLSSHSFENHNCAKEIESMKLCAVKLNTMKMNSTVGTAVLHQCEFCRETFDEQFTEEHFNLHHPGVHSSGNIKQYYANLNPESCSETVVVKTEPIYPTPDDVENGLYNFQGPDRYPIVNNSPSFNPLLNNISMPPPPVPIVQSTLSLPIHQFSSALGETSRPPASENASAINQQICKCVTIGVEKDVKPCLSCLSKVDVSKILQNSVIMPYEVAKIKKETSEDSEAPICNTQADGDTAASFTPSGELVGTDVCRNLFPFQFPVAFQLNPSLTPPSSHNGISPPSTPLVQSLTNGDPCSASDASIGSLTEAISQLDEPRAEELVHYINDDRSPDLPLMRGDDDQEIFPPIDSSRLEHVWDIDMSREIDAFAIVPFEGNETVEKYVCAACVFVSFSNKNSIIRHLCQLHQDKPKYLVLYISENDELL